MAFTAELPSIFVPFENVTVPPGVPAKLELTAAVKITDSLKLDGFGDEGAFLQVVSSPVSGSGGRGALFFFRIGLA